MTRLKTRSLPTFLAALGALAVCLLVIFLAKMIKESSGWLIPALVVLALTLTGYIVATLSVKSDSVRESPLTAICRGGLLGVNVAANVVLIAWILGGLESHLVVLIVAGILGLINLLAAIGPVSRSRVYQCVLGWSNWLLPMSWLVVALGLAFTLFSVLLHLLLTLPFKITFTRVGIIGGSLAGKRFNVDWASGTLFIYGGLVANLNRLKTAFNMGNFAFVHYKSSSSYTQHEVGHTLNLAAFGSLFHLIGAVDEIFSGHRAFSEFVADSNDAGGVARLMMW